MFTAPSYSTAMAFRKSFKAVPIQMGKRYRRQEAIARHKRTARFLGLAAGLGATVGVASVVITPGGAASALGAASAITVSAGIARARLPESGDYWYRCDDARAAGSAPLYAGEPGYRESLDRDGDGIACEPNRGMR
jgi:hypothetical protein